MTHMRETAAQRIARLQAEGSASAARMQENVASGQKMFCIHGRFLKRTEVQGGDGLVIYEPCSLCNVKATP